MASRTRGGGARSASPAPRSMTSTPRASRARFFCGIVASGYSGNESKRAASLGDTILHLADTNHFYLDFVTRLERTHASGGSRPDEIARLERHDGGDIREDVRDAEHHLRPRSALAFLAVHARDRRELII